MQFSREYAFVLGVVEAIGARRYVRTEVPVVVVYDAARQDLSVLLCAVWLHPCVAVQLSASHA